MSRSEKAPHSALARYFEALYRGKRMDKHSLTSTPPTLCAKWCSSISLVRVLSAKHVDVPRLIAQLKRTDNVEDKP